jgi:hypothetical protein
MKLLWPEMGCPWMKNGWSEISVLDEKYTCGAGYRMSRMKFFWGLIELDVLDENLMAGNGMILDENNG